jgi:hypothetical protein
MRLRKAIKKIVALGTGTTMIGATLLGASAANLNEYPSPFVKDGVFNGKIVVGAQAAAQDVIGSIEIATTLQSQSVTSSKVSTGGTSATTSLIGDSFKIEKSSDKLNMFELLNDPVNVASSDDLDALKGGSITNEKGTYKYDQRIDLENITYARASVIYEIDTDQDDDPAVYLKFQSGYHVYSYMMTFPTALKSDIDASDDWEDLDNKKISFLGTEYSIINTDHDTGVMEMMGGAIQDTIQEYEKKTYNLNGKDYEVEVVAISSFPEVILKVNGEVTEKKVEGDTIKLADGTEIGIKTILENEGTETGGGDMVTFYLGASKVVLTDADLSSGNTDGTLEVAGEIVDDVVVDIVGSNTSSVVSISKIAVTWTADDDYYVPVGGKLSDQLTGDEKDKLFLQNLDFEFAALQKGSERKIIVQDANSDRYRVSFPTLTGGTINEEFFYSDTAGNVSLGREASRPLIVDPAVNISKNGRFLVSQNKYSHVLEVTGFKSTSTDQKVTFKNLGTGNSFEVGVTGGEGEFFLDGNSFKFNANVGGEQIKMQSFGGDGNGVVYTPEEFKIQFQSVVNASLGGLYTGALVVTEYEEERADGTGMETITVSISDTSTTDIDVASLASSDGNFSMKSWRSKDKFKTGYTEYGTFVEQDTDDQDDITIYIGDEAVAEVFLTSGTTSISSSGGSEEGTVTTTTVNEIEVGSAVLDTEISDVTSDNYISVGGPCANSVSARLVGVAQKIPECLSGLSLSEGEGVVKLFENGAKVSMLVAGATALDSQRAARVVAQSAKYPEFTGMEVSVTGTSLSDITVSAPTPMDEE